MTGVLSCARCTKVLRVVVTVDDATYGEDPEIEESIDIDLVDGDGKISGVLWAICGECLTTREAWQHLAQTASRAVTFCEDVIRDLDMVMERIPALRDNPEAKARYAKVQQQLIEHQAMLQALLENEPEEES